MKPFFIEIQNFRAWADKLGRYILWHWVFFRPNYQHPFCYSKSLAHVFHYSAIIFTKKAKPLYPRPKCLFGIGIWILIWAAKNYAFECPQSVGKTCNFEPSFCVAKSVLLRKEHIGRNSFKSLYPLCSTGFLVITS